MSLSSDRPRSFLCFVTNSGYAPGAVCLAQSLALVGSRARLRVIATSIDARDALISEIARSPPPEPPIDIVLEETMLPNANENGAAHNGSGATLAADAPDAACSDKREVGFCWTPI